MKDWCSYSSLQFFAFLAHIIQKWSANRTQAPLAKPLSMAEFLDELHVDTYKKPFIDNGITLETLTLEFMDELFLPLALQSYIWQCRTEVLM